MNVRRQLTLFLDEIDTYEIEAIRKKYNHLQYKLIKSHVTLCREDEIVEIDQILQNIKSLHQKSITINFEKIKRFSDEKGVLIAAFKNNAEFYNLRNEILKNTNIGIRFPEPHITLMHPRNSICTDEIFEEILKFDFPKSIKFEKISLIEQVNNEKWKIIDVFSM